MRAKTDWTSQTWYSFSLMLSLHAVYFRTPPRGGWKPASKLFEKLTTDVVSLYLHGPALNIGAPRQGRGMPSGFRGALDKISNDTHEKLRQGRPRNSRSQDAGVDVISWIPFPDKRSSQLILLVSCKASGNIDDLAIMLSLARWDKLVEWAFPPVRVFSFPYICPESKWLDVSGDGGLLLDRIRLVQLQNRRRASALLGPTRAWCRQEAARFSRLIEG